MDVYLRDEFNDPKLGTIIISCILLFKKVHSLAIPLIIAFYWQPLYDPFGEETN